MGQSLTSTEEEGEGLHVLSSAQEESLISGSGGLEEDDNRIKITKLGAEIIKRVRTNDKSVESLRIDNKNLGFGLTEDEINGIFKALQSNTNLTNLELTGFDRLRLNQINCLCDFLQEQNLRKTNQKRITSLTVRNSNFDEEMMNFFSIFLSSDSSIKELNLEGNSGFNDECCHRLYDALTENETLETLNLGNNSFGEQGLFYLGEMIKNNEILKKLDISRDLPIYDIGASGYKNIFQNLKKNQSLTSLNLSANRIGNENKKLLIEILKENKNLKILNLGFMNLGKNEETNSFNFFENFASVSEENELEELNLNRNKITDEEAKEYIAKIIKNSKNLKKLFLDFNSIEDEGCLEICEVLNQNSNLLQLNLSNNEISEKGIRGIGDLLKINKNLTKFSFDKSEFSEIFCEILKENSNLREFEFCESRIFLQNCEKMNLFAFLEKNACLTKLDFSKCFIGNEGCKEISNFLKKNSKLLELNLTENAIGEEGCEHLGGMLKFSKIQNLNLSGNAFGDNGILKLINFEISEKKNLEKIEGNLGKNTSLQKLNIKDTCITDLAIEKIIGIFGINPNFALSELEFVSQNNSIKRSTIALTVKYLKNNIII